MSFATKHNSAGRLFAFDIPEHFTHKDLKDLAKAHGLTGEYRIRAMFINKKGLYGDQPTVATDNELVNFPHHMADVCKEILSDAESISMINNGNAGFKLYEYENQYGVQYGVEFID